MNSDEEGAAARSCENRHAIEVVAERISALERLMNERDKRYHQSFEESKNAVTAALIAAKEQTMASFVASEKAITKAEAGQLQYNAFHNDLTRKMDVQYSLMLPRTEAQKEFTALTEKLSDLRESRSQIGGRGEGLHQGWVLLLGIASLVGIALGIASFLRH